MSSGHAADLLEELVRVPSASGAEGEAVGLFVARLAELGFDASIDGAGNAVGKIGWTGPSSSRGPHVVLLGHIDTVSGEVPVRRERGCLYGRGTVDAKGSLVAFAAAAARAAADGSLACRVELVACVEEEAASSKGARHRAAGPVPDACIVGEPSGWSGVTVGYKGFLRARLEREGSMAHTAGEAPGLGALSCRLWTDLEEEARRFARAEDGAPLFEQLLTHLSAVRVEGDGLLERAQLDVRLRLPPDLPPEAARAWLVERAPGWSIAAEGGLPAWSASRSSSLARALGRSIAAAGGRARFQRKTGTADANVVAPAWGCPVVAYGPGDSSLDHTPHEHLELAELARAIDVLAWGLGPDGIARLVASSGTRAAAHA